MKINHKESLNGKKFQHKYFRNTFIEVEIRKGNNDNLEHLYINLVEGHDLVGMSGQRSFMLATSNQKEHWDDILTEWTESNQYYPV